MQKPSDLVRQVQKMKTLKKIGTRFHSWFRDNLDKVGIEQDDSEGFQSFVDKDFKFFLNAYKHILTAERKLTEALQHVFYIRRWGIANSLSYPLLLASLKTTDNSDTVLEKIDLVARYIEAFVVRRSVNFQVCFEFHSLYYVHSGKRNQKNRSVRTQGYTKAEIR